MIDNDQSGSEHSTVKRPNLIYIFADQLRYQSCGYAGDPLAQTPNINALASESVSFSNAVSGHPVCAPYRASLFTGKYTTSTGMVINEIRLNPAQSCIGHILTENNYQTIYIGKWHLWAAELGNHHDPKNSFTPPGQYRLGFDGFWAAYNFHHNYVNSYYHTDTPKKITLPGFEPDGQTDIAINQIRQAKRQNQPFALFLSYGTPHDPWVKENVPAHFLELFDADDFTLPPNYKDQNDPYADSWAVISPDERKEISNWKRCYYAMTANLDWNIGRLLKALDEMNLRDNTIVIFTSDHGEMFGAQGRRAKNIFYDEAVRVPFLVRWPGKIPPGTTSDACLNTPDIMPTLLSMLDLPIPETVEGENLSHCALGEDGAEPEVALMECTGATAAWKDGHEWRALRDKRFTYAVYRADGQEYLFDNSNDPYQIRNLINDIAYTAVIGHFRALLKEKMTNLNDGFEACTWYRDHWTENRIILRSAKGAF